MRIYSLLDKGLFSKYDILIPHPQRIKKKCTNVPYRVDKRRNFGMFTGHEKEPVMYDYCNDGHSSQYIHPAFHRRMLCL